MLLPEGVWIGERATCPLGESGWSCFGWRCALRVIRGKGPYTLHTQTVPLATRDIAYSTRGYLCPTDIPPSPDISQSAPDVGWERMAIQLPGQACPDPLIVLTRRAFAVDNSDSPDSLARQTLAICWIHFRPPSKSKLR